MRSDQDNDISQVITDAILRLWREHDIVYTEVEIAMIIQGFYNAMNSRQARLSKQ